jgi:hypothetical protein
MPTSNDGSEPNILYKYDGINVGLLCIIRAFAIW